MIPTMVTGTSISDVWYQFVYQLAQENAPGVREYRIDKGSYEGQKRLEFEFAIGVIQQPWIRPLIPVFPSQLNIPPVADYAEDPQEAIDSYLPYLASPSKQPNELYTYGERLMVSWDYVIEYFRKHGWNTNRMIMEIGRPEDIFFYDKEDGHTPCLRMIVPRIYDGKLHYFVFFRSWDLWNGFPVNLGGIQQMKEVMVYEIGGGLQDGTMVVASTGLHIYDHHEIVVKARLYKDKNLFKNAYDTNKKI